MKKKKKKENNEKEALVYVSITFLTQIFGVLI
jgi:hypothetical protein